VPSQDIVLGLYYLSIVEREASRARAWPSPTWARSSTRSAKAVTLHTKIKGRFKTVDADGKPLSKIYETTPGRMISANCCRRTQGAVRRLSTRLMTKKNISKMIDTVYRHCGQKETVIFCDRIMALGFKHMPARPASRSARTTWSSREPRRRSSPRPKRWQGIRAAVQ
jgi:DNA-directed RNA polymerase subunit beta'